MHLICLDWAFKTECLEPCWLSVSNLLLIKSFISAVLMIPPKILLTVEVMLFVDVVEVIICSFVPTSVFMNGCNTHFSLSSGTCLVSNDFWNSFQCLKVNSISLNIDQDSVFWAAITYPKFWWWNLNQYSTSYSKFSCKGVRSGWVKTDKKCFFSAVVCISRIAHSNPAN